MAKSVPSASSVLRVYLDWRRRCAPARAAAEDEQVIGCLRACIDAYVPNLLGQAGTTRLLAARSAGLDAGDVVDAHAIADAIPEFLEVWLPVRLRATESQVETARAVLHRLVRWFWRRDVVGIPTVLDLERYLAGSGAPSRSIGR